MPQTTRINLTERDCSLGKVVISHFEHVDPQKKDIKVRIIDDEDIQCLGRELFGLVDNQRFSRVVVNFDNVSYMSSAFLGKLITLDRKVKEAGSRGLLLCRVRPEVYEVFAITRMDRVVTIFQDEEEALAHF